MPLLKNEAPSLEDVDKWINSSPINIEDGTYLLYFWNYSCDCCRDRLKLFQHIHQKYTDIKVVGIHTPEFGFEKNERNLKRAVEKLEVNHPVAHDSDGKVSERYDMAYSNQALVIDEGSIVFQQRHRVETTQLEKKISDILGGENNIELPEIDQQKSSQEFFGYSRTAGLNEEGNYPGKKDWQLPENRKQGETYLKGAWEQKKHFIEAKTSSELRYSFKSSEVNTVMDPNEGIRDIKVLINGEPVPEEEAGEDLYVENGESYIRVRTPGVYNLFDSNNQKCEITFIPDKKTRFYALSFR